MKKIGFINDMCLLNVLMYIYVFKIILEAVIGPLKYNSLKCAKSADELISALDRFTLFPGR